MNMKSNTKPKAVKKLKVKVKSPLQKEYDNMNNDQKHLFINKVCEATERGESTVRSWIRGASTPTPLEQKAVAKILRIEAAQLFK
jgi:hypothetical protein